MTYLAAVCRIWNVAMDTIQKPVRHVAQNTRSSFHGDFRYFALLYAWVDISCIKLAM